MSECSGDGCKDVRMEENTNHCDYTTHSWAAYDRI